MAKARSRLVLVFGESDNDRSAIIEIAKAVRPDAKVSFSKRAKPLVLLRSTETNGTRRSTAEEIAKLVKAASVADDVIGVIAHRDCDDVEPAHTKVAEEIESALLAAGVQAPVAAAPAFEMEAWWLLFPDAVASVRACWRRVPQSDAHVGSVPNAKEHLRRCLRPVDAKQRKRCPDYAESDCLAIARAVRELSLINAAALARSGSLADFYAKMQTLPVA